MRFLFVAFLCFASTACGDSKSVTPSTVGSKKPVIETVRLVVYSRPEITDAEQVEIAKRGLARGIELRSRDEGFFGGVDIRVKEVISLPDPFPNQYNTIDRPTYLNRGKVYYADLRKRKIVPNDKVFTVLLLPPATDGTSNYGGGVCYSPGGMGSFGSYAYAIVRKQNSSGEPRDITSETTVAHEVVGHGNDASHSGISYTSMPIAKKPADCVEVGTLFGNKKGWVTCLNETPNIMHEDAGKFGNVHLNWLNWSTGWEVAEFLKDKNYLRAKKKTKTRRAPVTHGLVR